MAFSSFRQLFDDQYGVDARSAVCRRFFQNVGADVGMRGIDSFLSDLIIESLSAIISLTYSSALIHVLGMKSVVVWTLHCCCADEYDAAEEELPVADRNSYYRDAGQRS